MRLVLLVLAIATAAPPAVPASSSGATDCKKVKAACIDECSKKALPSKDHGVKFFRCLNACMEQHGCLGKA